AEDGIRDPLVTGVQTCALPIYDDLVEGHPQVVRDDLGERRLVALAVRGGPREGGDVAARLDAHDRALERPEAAHLDVARHADAEQRPVAAAHARLLVSAELLDAGDLQ